MNCQETRKWISPYLDSELDPTKTFEVSQHLESCADCRARFDKEARTEQLIAEKLREPVSFFDWQGLTEQILTPAVQRIRRMPKWPLAMAACIAFVLIGIYWSSPSIAGHPAQWAVNELHQLRPTCSAFESGQQCNPNYSALAGEVLESAVDLPLNRGNCASHKMSVVHAMKRVCPGGKCRLEVRLNCCGKPILVNIGRVNEMGRLFRVSDAVCNASDGWYEDPCREYGETFHVSARKAGDYVIVAVSPHAVHDLVQEIIVLPGKTAEAPPTIGLPSVIQASHDP